MNKYTLFMFMFVLLSASGCSTLLKSKWPTTYSDINDADIHKDKLLGTGQLMMLHIGSMLPGDTISVYIENQIVLENVTVSNPYPTSITSEQYGGHGEYCFDYLLFKRNHSHYLSLVNLNDPRKKVINKVKVKGNIHIKAIDEKGNQRDIEISKDLNHFIEIQFLHYDYLYVDTSYHIQLLD